MSSVTNTPPSNGLSSGPLYGMEVGSGGGGGGWRRWGVGMGSGVEVGSGVGKRRWQGGSEKGVEKEVYSTL